MRREQTPLHATLTENQFMLLASRTGLPLRGADVLRLYAAYRHVESMNERVRRTREGMQEMEPAHLFKTSATHSDE